MQTPRAIPPLKTTSSQKSSPEKQRRTTKKIKPLHRTQKLVYTHLARFRIVVCGRRWGKSKLGLTEVIRAATQGNPPYDPESPPVVVVAMPSLKQAKKIFWKPLLNLLDKHPWVDVINRTDFTISFKNPNPEEFYRPDIVVLGLNDKDGDRARGLKIFFFLGDEFQDVKPTILSEIIIPAMTDTPGSRALLTATPKGKVNHVYKLDQQCSDRYVKNADQDKSAGVDRLNDWAVFRFHTADNPFIPRKELETAEKTLPPRVFRQEYKGSYEDFPGKVYDQMEDHHEVAQVPHRFTNTYLGIDWGDIHPALVVIGETLAEFDGRLTRHYWVIDEFHNESDMPVLEEDLLSQAIAFCDQYKITQSFADPSRPASIDAWKKRGIARGIPGLIQIYPGFNAISEGNQIVNALYYQNRLRIKASLQYLADCDKSYHRKSDRNGNILDEIAPGQDDHTTDAKRYVLATLESQGDRKPSSAAPAQPTRPAHNVARRLL